jgi:hypothetical protein
MFRGGQTARQRLLRSQVSEWITMRGTVLTSSNIPLSTVADRIRQVNVEEPFPIFCIYRFVQANPIQASARVSSLCRMGIELRTDSHNRQKGPGYPI